MQREEVESDGRGTCAKGSKHCQGQTSFLALNKLLDPGSGVRLQSSNQDDISPFFNTSSIKDNWEAVRGGEHCKYLKTKGRATLSDHLIS